MKHSMFFKEKSILKLINSRIFIFIVFRSICAHVTYNIARFLCVVVFLFNWNIFVFLAQFCFEFHFFGEKMNYLVLKMHKIDT